MNKQLQATTALVAVSMLAATSLANAAGKTVKLGLHGYMEQIVGVVFDRSDNEATTARANSKTSFDQMTESEIHFKGSGKLDNGITIIADVQLEVSGSPGNLIDEQYMIVRGGFGQLTLGSEDNAGHLMTIGYLGSWATGVGQSLTFDLTDWISLASGINAGARFDGTLNDPRLRSLDNDSSKISYFTPRFSGFQVGASYIPNFQQQTATGGGGSVAGKSGNYHEGWAIGANYTGKFDKVGVGIADIMTGMHSAVAVLAALRHRDATNEGQHIDMALLDAQVSWLSYVGENYLVSNEVPERLGSHHPNIVPYQVFEAQDGLMVLAVGNDAQFKRFCTFAGIAEIAEDERFTTNGGRVTNRETITSILADIIKTKPINHWVDGLIGVNVPCSPINTIDQVFANPQVEAREMKIEMEHPLASNGKVDLIGSPIKLSASPVSYRHPPPMLGQHTDEILAEHGYSPADIAGLREAKAI